MVKVYKLLRCHSDVIHFHLNEFIFPKYTRHQIIKLSESGQALGSSVLFPKARIGFSGTPSDLMPIELGGCGYEKASDGLVVNCMTDPQICTYEVCEEEWDSLSILKSIALKQNPPYHALIDTGALITGLSNARVARELLKQVNFTLFFYFVYIN
jgi:hypothetical protein